MRKKTNESLYFCENSELLKRNRLLSFIIIILIFLSIFEGYIIYNQQDLYNKKKVKAFAISDDGRSFMLSEKIDEYRSQDEIMRFGKLFTKLLYNVSWRDFSDERIKEGTSNFNNVLAMCSPSLRSQILKQFNNQDNGESFITFFQKHKTGMIGDIESEHPLNLIKTPFNLELIVNTKVKGIKNTDRKNLVKLSINRIPRSDKNDVSRSGLEITDYEEVNIKN